jgi:xylulokinase
MTFLGVDLGTSALKVLLLDQEGRIVATAQRTLRVARPQPRWAEQDPAEWWLAAQSAIDALKQSHAAELSAVRAIGLSGQMHGATLLDRGDRALRPAILWNDTRADVECAQLESLVPAMPIITGNLAMPGFTAPKVLWVANHEPELFSKISSVLLPKDYLRLCLTGDKVSDSADASGTLWMNVGERKWSEQMLAATKLTEAHVPTIVESNAPAGYLRRTLASQWGMQHPVVVAGGAGDNAASAVGVGATADGEGFISLGTSGVVFVANDSFRPNTASGLHAFCHALPNRWHQMSVMLSAASCLQWAARLCGAASEASFVQATTEAGPHVWTSAPVFLPYLSGERTPHNDAHAQGVFFGLTHDTDSAALGYAVMEGVAFGLADGLSTLVAVGTVPTKMSLVGGGSRSEYWVQLISNVLQVPVVTHASGQVGAVIGAARLARMASGESVEQVCQTPPVLREYEPQSSSTALLAERFRLFRSIYPSIRGLYRKSQVR